MAAERDELDWPEYISEAWTALSGTRTKDRTEKLAELRVWATKREWSDLTVQAGLFGLTCVCCSVSGACTGAGSRPTAPLDRAALRRLDLSPGGPRGPLGSPRTRLRL